MVMGAMRGRCSIEMAAPFNQSSFYNELLMLGLNAIACQVLV